MEKVVKQSAKFNAKASLYIREATVSAAQGIARVHVEAWRTTYKGIVPDSHLASLDMERKEQSWRQILSQGENHFAFVAETEDKQIVGFASAGKNPEPNEDFAGKLYALYLLESYQRQGIGRRLMEAVAKKFAQQKISSLILGVLADNPFRAFYEWLGGTYVSEKETVIGGVLLIEVAYGWRNLDRLLQQ